MTDACVVEFVVDRKNLAAGVAENVIDTIVSRDLISALTPDSLGNSFVLNYIYIDQFFGHMAGLCGPSRETVIRLY